MNARAEAAARAAQRVLEPRVAALEAAAATRRGEDLTAAKRQALIRAGATEATAAFLAAAVPGKTPEEIAASVRALKGSLPAVFATLAPIGSPATQPPARSQTVRVAIAARIRGLPANVDRATRAQAVSEAMLDAARGDSRCDEARLASAVKAPSKRPRPEALTDPQRRR